MAYKKFIHVERLGKDETKGILQGRVLVTPKLDGTNALAYWDGVRNQVGGGSRNRELNAIDDNAGFYNWLHSDNVEAIRIRKFIEDNPELILYGEFKVGQIGSIKDYNPEAREYLWLFDCFDLLRGVYVADDDWREWVDQYGLTNWCVPIYLDKVNPTVEEIMAIAQENNFLLDHANHPGEGVVIRNNDYRDQWGHYQVAKIVLDEYKQNKSAKKTPVPEGDIEAKIVSVYVTDAELAKAKAKTCAYFGVEEFEKSGKFIGFYMSTVWKESVLEEVADWTKKLKNPTVNFKTLQSLTQQACRKYLGLI